MISVYKGHYYILNTCKYNHKINNKYFIQHISPIMNSSKWYLVKLYQKKKQFYKLSSLKYLNKFLNLNIYNPISQTPNNNSQVDTFNGDTLQLIPFEDIRKYKTTLLVKCHSKQQPSVYVGCPELCLKFINKGFTHFYSSTPDSLDNVADILFNPLKNIWAIYDRKNLLILDPKTTQYIYNIKQFMNYLYIKEAEFNDHSKNIQDSKLYNLHKKMEYKL